MVKKIGRLALIILLCSSIAIQAQKPPAERAKQFIKAFGAAVATATTLYYAYDTMCEEKDSFIILSIHLQNWLKGKKSTLMDEKDSAILKHLLKSSVHLISLGYFVKKCFDSAKFNFEKAFEKEKAPEPERQKPL